LQRRYQPLLRMNVDGLRQRLISRYLFGVDAIQHLIGSHHPEKSFADRVLQRNRSKGEVQLHKERPFMPIRS
jgi:hypothetical protein